MKKFWPVLNVLFLLAGIGYFAIRTHQITAAIRRELKAEKAKMVDEFDSDLKKIGMVKKNSLNESNLYIVRTLLWNSRIGLNLRTGVNSRGREELKKSIEREVGRKIGNWELIQNGE